MTATIQVILSVAFAILIFATQEQNAQSQSPARQTYQQVVAYTPSANGAPIIDVIFDGSIKARMVFDTGSSEMGITDDLATKLGLTEKGLVTSVVINGKSLPLVTVPRMAMGQFHLDNTPFVILDSKNMKQTMGNDQVKGIIGANFLAVFPAMFNFQDHQITLYSQSLTEQDLTAIGMNDSTIIPLLEQDNDFIFTCPISVRNGTNSATAALQIDTGAPDTVLSNSVASELGLSPLGSTMKAKAYDSSEYQFAQASISDFTVGGVSSNVLSVYYETKKTPTDMLLPLGLDMLSHYRILLDYKKKVIYIKPAGSVAVSFRSTTQSQAP